MLYPPLNFVRSSEAAPPEFQGAEFYQPTLGAALYLALDPDDPDFGWVGWDLPSLGDGQQEVALETVLELVAPRDRAHVVSRTQTAILYAQRYGDEHQDSERVRAMASYYRRVLRLYAQGGLAALGDAPLRPPVEEERERHRLNPGS